MHSKLGQAIDGAYKIRYDARNGYTLVWFGGSTIAVFLPNGEQLTTIGIGENFINNLEADQAYVIMGELIERNTYPDDR